MAVEADDLAARLKAESLMRCAAVSWWPTTGSGRHRRVPARRTSARPPTLLAHADRAMYGAKRAGGGCWRLYEDTEQAADPALA